MKYITTLLLLLIQLSASTQKIAELRMDSISKYETSVIANRLACLELENKKIRKELEELSEKYRKLKTRVIRLERRVKELARNLRSKDQELKKVESELSIIQPERDSLSKRVVELENQLMEEIQLRHESQRREIEALNKLDSLFFMLEDQAILSNKKRRELRNEINKLENTITDLTTITNRTLIYYKKNRSNRWGKKFVILDSKIDTKRTTDLKHTPEKIAQIFIDQIYLHRQELHIPDYIPLKFRIFLDGELYDEIDMEIKRDVSLSNRKFPDGKIHIYRGIKRLVLKGRRDEINFKSFQGGLAYTYEMVKVSGRNEEILRQGIFKFASLKL